MENTTQIQPDIMASNEPSAAEQSPPALSFPSPNTVAQSDLLQDSVFPAFKADSTFEDPDPPEELQKQEDIHYDNIQLQMFQL